jgi:hypothetical protein
MKRHLFGIVAFALSCALGTGLTSLFGPSGSDQRAVSIRTYALVSTYATDSSQLDVVRRGAEGAWTEAFDGPDGARLYLLTFEYGSEREARERFAALSSAGFGNTLAESSGPSRERSSCRHASLIFLSNAVTDPSRETHPGDSGCGDAWVDGSRLNIVVGPTVTHVSELARSHSSFFH